MRPESPAAKLSAPEPVVAVEPPLDPLAAMLLRRLDERRRQAGIQLSEPLPIGAVPAEATGSEARPHRAREPTGRRNAGRAAPATDEVAVLAAELRSRVADPAAHPLLFRDVATAITEGRLSRDRAFGWIADMDRPGTKLKSRGATFRGNFNEAMKS